MFLDGFNSFSSKVSSSNYNWREDTSDAEALLQSTAEPGYRGTLYRGEPTHYTGRTMIQGRKYSFFR